MIKRILVINAATATEDGKAIIAAVDSDVNGDLGGVISPAIRDFPIKGVAETLALEVQSLLKQVQWSLNQLDMIIAITGPGSFTGIRAALALATGIGIASDIALIGLDLGEIFLPVLMKDSSGRFPVCVMQARRNRLFVSTPEENYACALDAIRLPQEDCILAGDGMDLLYRFWMTREEQSGKVGLFKAENGLDTYFCSETVSYQFSPLIYPTIAHIVQAGLHKYYAAKEVSFYGKRKIWLDFSPLYIDPPEAKLPEGGLRSLPI